MKKVEREEQILRIQQASFHEPLNEALEQHLRSEIVSTVQAIVEEALVEELASDLASRSGSTPRRSGYYERGLGTLYGHIEALRVPKLRWGNPEREWQILQRDQRHLAGVLDYASQLYVMGLSIRDLQEALYVPLGQVLSTTAVNQVTLRVQSRMKEQRQAAISQTPPILIVDGVWVDIQYALDQLKVDRAGHQRQVRHAQERVILVAMAVWPDASYEVLHYEVALTEDQYTWSAFLDHLIARGLDPRAVELIVSDGTKGLLTAMKQYLPKAQQQRCITHKVRGMAPYLTDQHLPETDPDGHLLDPDDAKKQRRFDLFQDAYAIYDAPSAELAQGRLADFVLKWQPLEPQAVHAFTWGIKRTFSFFQLPAHLHRLIRTTNLLERFFREFRAKADEIGAFPNETSCLTLFFLVLQRDHAKHNRFSLANNS